jgi:hypothetical protein
VSPTDRRTHAPEERELGLHLESAAADLVSKPTTRLSMGTKIPPPPTPPTVPNAEPRKPTTVATTTRQLKARSYGESSTRSGHSEQNSGGAEGQEQRERAAYGPDARRARSQAEPHIAVVVGGRVRGGEHEAGENGGAGGPSGNVGEQPPRAGPVDAAVQ